MRARLMWFVPAVALAVFAVAVAGSSADTTPTLTAAQIQQFTAMDAAVTPMTASTTKPFNGVTAHVYDPGDTDSAQAKWLDGTGCPNAAATNNTSSTNGGNVTDSACGSADPKDEENSGLLLEKAQTPENSLAFGELKGVKGTTVSELGYDIRKVGTRFSANGSHCGAGAPRFDVFTTDGLFFVGCQSPPPDSETAGDAWIRLRWGAGGVVLGFQGCCVPVPITGTVQHIFIVYDEGTDAGPDFFGAAFVDNIEYNGTLVGKG